MPSRDLVLIAILTICAVQGACSDEEDPATPHDVSITFQALVGAQPADCASVYSGLGESGVEARLADARLFVSQVELRASTGEWQTVELVDSEWQHDGVALLDFRDLARRSARASMLRRAPAYAALPALPWCEHPSPNGPDHGFVQQA